jgi:hypothetical protein
MLIPQNDAVDVAFDGPGAVRQREAGGDGGPVFAQAGDEAAQFADGAGSGLIGPRGELAAGAVHEHIGEVTDQGAGGAEFRAAAGDGAQGGPVVVGEVAGRGKDPGGHFLGRGRWRAGRAGGFLAEPGGVAAQRAQAAVVAAGADLLVQPVGAVAAFFPPLVQVGQVRVEEAGLHRAGAGAQVAGAGGGDIAAHGPCGPGAGGG